MKVDDFDIRVLYPKPAMEPKGGSAGFGKIYESSLSEAERSDKSTGDCADSRRRLFGGEANDFVDIGVVSSERPTVSHLLIDHPEYGGDCWKIIHSDLNKSKPYRRIPAGTRIHIDPDSKEIVWNDTNRDRPCPPTDGSSTAAESTPPSAKTGRDFFKPEKRIGEQELIRESVSKAAAKYNLSPDLINGVIRAESDYQVHAVSEAGAQGLMQLMPATAKELGVKNPFDIEENIDGGTRYLKRMLDIFDGDLVKALAAYNAGPGAVKCFGGRIPFQETRLYVQRILSFLNDRR